MNFKAIRKILGRILMLEGVLMVVPLVFALAYGDPLWSILAFVITIVGLEAIGLLLRIKTKNASSFQARDAFVTVGMSWILMAIFGAIPFVISGEIPNFINALFEISSGFTTTGASILNDIESLSKGMLLWRSLSNWIGGMGVLVFILAITSDAEQNSTSYLLKAESPGPQVSKLVSKMRFSARILYLIYIGITVIEMAILLIGGMNFFEAVTTSMSTAGTGGFSIMNNSMAFASPFNQCVIGIFMLIFGINFSLFYLILIGRVRQFFKSEELRVYIGIIIVSIVIIMINCASIYNSFGENLRNSFFQVSSIITTTGFTTVDYELWPSLSKAILFILMICGACAGSTGGGMKISRLIILAKTSYAKIANFVNPRRVKSVKFESKPVSVEIQDSIFAFSAIYFIAIILVALIISIDNFDIITNLSASVACISNIGPGFGLVGPTGNYEAFNGFSKIILSLEMILGRLELYPLLVLFSPRTWIRGRF